MSQQHPNTPQGPGRYGPPEAPYQSVAPYQPEPPKKKSWFARHKIMTVIGGLVAVIVIGGIVTGGEDTTSDTAKTAPGKQADAKPAEEPKDASQAEQFKAYVEENGTGPEKAAAKHVIKVQGADSRTDILDTADIYTDYEGGLTGPNRGDAQLLTSAFADWKTSKNGLVTVYDQDGQLMANGKF